MASLAENLSGYITCPSCRHANPPGNLFCANCAARLVVGNQPVIASHSHQNASQLKGSGSTPLIWKSIEAKKQKGISGAKTGLLLLILGLLLGPIPYLMYLGAIFAIVGAIMVILGQNRFDPNHSNITIGAAVIYIVGLGINFFATGVFAISITGAPPKTANLRQALTDNLNGFLVTGLIGTMVIGVAYVLFTYALQDKSGRRLLYVSFGAQLAFGVLVAYIVSGQIAGAVSQALRNPGYDPTPISALLGRIQELELLGLSSAGLFAITHYRAYSRIGEIFPRQ